MVSFAGIGSGLDLSSLIDGLVAVERIPIQQIQLRQQDANRQLTQVGRLNSMLKSVQSAAEKLDQTNEVRAVTSSSSDEGFMTVSASDAALVGSYDVRVDTIAKPQVSTSQLYAQNTAGMVGTGSIGITVGGATQVDIVLDGSETLEDIASKINNSTAKASASVVFDGTNYRLMIQSNDVGTANTIAFQENSITMGLTDPANIISNAQDAQIQLNGITVTRSSNTISDLLTGVTLNLEAEMAVGDPDVRLRVADDPEALRTKVEDLTSKINDVMSFINEELSSGATGGGASSLQGDSTLQSLQRRLSSVLSSGYTAPSGTVSLGNVGITLSETGSLTIDADAFAAALQADPTRLSGLLAGDGTTSLTATLKNLADEYTKSGTGTLATKESGLRSRIDSFEDQIERIEDRADRLETRLRRTFAALDVKMADLNNQSSYLTNAFGAGQQQG